MAVWKIKEIKHELSSHQLLHFEELENRLGEITKTSMADPEMVEEGTKQLRETSQYISIILRALQLAVENRVEFYQTYNSMNSLCNRLTGLLNELNPEDPEQAPVIKTYKDILEKNSESHDVLIWTKAYLELPKAKKRYKKWQKKDWGVVNKTFPPQLTLELKLKKLEDFLEENF